MKKYILSILLAILICGSYVLAIEVPDTTTTTELSTPTTTTVPPATTTTVSLQSVCSVFIYSSWTSCLPNGTQTRNIISSSPDNCSGGNPILIQSCSSSGPKISYISPTSAYYGQEVDIVGNGFGNRTIIGEGQITDGGAGIFIDGQSQGKNFLISWTDTKIRVRILDPKLTQHNTTRLGSVLLVVSIPEQPNSNSVPITLLGACDEWQCGEFSQCQSNSTKIRVCTQNPSCPIITTPMPATVQSCSYIPTIPICSYNSWSCDNWSNCSSYGSQTRTCNKIQNCSGGISPATTQSCTYVPACTSDSWTCGAWESCSPSGIQKRSCTKSFDCPNVQTVSPITDQYCVSPERSSSQTVPSGTDEILNQDSIIKASVKLMCPFDAQRVSQGSGTVIDPSGVILTNKHVIAGTLGCLVGFIDDFNDEPNISEQRQIADIVKISPNQDIAILKIRNPKNMKLTSIDITKGNSNLRLGSKITTYGYPAKFGEKITYTSGDFSGTDGSYLKTTAVLEYGNSGGGAYLKDGTFIGIPSAVVKGELNSLGYILSVNTINSWLGNSNMAYGSTNNNNYSRVSVLEDIDLNKLGSLKLFIPDTDAKGDLTTSVKNQDLQKTADQSQSNQTQKESNIVGAADKKQKTNLDQSNSILLKKEQKPKVLWFKRIFQWVTNLFR